MADCRSRFLTDEPTTEDFFGSREPVAELLADIVSETEGGKTVGLVGAWGSGKSSVVGAMREKLKARNDGRHHYEVITFDAWSHEGDPLRRVFLERLERDLRSLGWIEDSEVSDSLACRTSLSVKEEGIQLTPEGEVLAICLALSASLLLFLGATSSQPSMSSPFVMSVAAVATLLTPMAALVIYLRGLHRTTRSRSEGERRQRQDLLSLLANKPPTVARTTTTSAPDPTSVDFEDLFRGLVRRALADESRVLVVVVDNLDRIDPTNARSVWSTLRTFLDAECVSTEAHLTRMWLVVPFARDGIGRVIGDDPMVATAALDKVFDLTLEVAPPISSRWRDYFFEQFGKALPEHAGSPELHTIFRLYGAFDRDQWPMTPRAAKRFVNKLVAIHHRWVHEIPLVSQALFVLLNGGEVDLVDPAALPRAALYLAGDDWRSDLAALLYGLPVEMALQAILEPRIAQALEAGDSRVLRETASVPGFEILLETAVSKSAEDWVAARPLTGFLAAIAIEEVGLDRGNHAVNATWRRLAGFASAVRDWDGLELDLMHGVAAVIRYSDDPPGLAAIVTRSLSNVNLDGLGPDKWCQAILRLCDEFTDEPELAASVVSNVTVPGDAPQYLTVLSAARGAQPPELIAALRPAAATEDIEAAALEAVGEEPMTERVESALAVLPEALPGAPVDALVQALCDRIREPAPLSAETAVRIAALLRAYRDFNPGLVQSAIGDCMRDGSLSRQWGEANDRAGHVEAAGLVSLGLEALAAGFPLAEVAWHGSTETTWDRLMSGEERELRAQVAAIARESGSWLLDLLTGEPEMLARFAAGLMRELLQDGFAVLDLFGWRTVVSKYDAVADVCGDSIVVDYVVESGGPDSITGDGFTRTRSRLYRDAMKSGRTGADFEAFVVKGMSEFDTRTWRDVILRKTASFSLLELLLAAGRRELFGSHLAKAIAVLSQVDEPGSADVLPRLKLARDALTAEARTELDRALLKHMMAPTGAWGIRDLRADWGDTISSSDVFGEEPTRFLDTVAAALLDWGDLKDLSWLHAVLESHPEILNQASGRARRDARLRTRRRVALKKTGKRNREILESMLPMFK